MEKDTKFILAGIIIIIVITITFFFIVYLSPDIKQNRPISYYIVLNQTTIGNDNIISIRGISSTKINPDKFDWQIMDQNNFILYKNEFPKLGGIEGSTSDDNITVIWLDNDNDNKLSVDDSIRIESLEIDLDGYIFRLVIKYDETHYSYVSKIELD